MKAARAGKAVMSHLVREDAELAHAIPASERERACEEIVAPTLTIPTGHWSGEHARRGHGLGLLVMNGLLIRRVGIERAFGAELLGAGDLLRPWHGEDELPTLVQRTGWRALEPTTVAVLDRSTAFGLLRYPMVAECLIGRALGRSRNLAVNMAIVHQTRVDVRLHMLFWHLADRWGYVRPNGVVLPLRLTHAVLADLVAARRPTVSSALSELADRGLVYPRAKEWLLSGHPPGELTGPAPAASRVTAASDGAASRR